MLQFKEKLHNRGLLGIVQRTCNYVDPRLMDHGLRVAYTMSKLLERLEIYDRISIRDICFVALVHDIGAYKTEEISRMVQFETGNVWQHAIYGYLFLQRFSPLKDYSQVVLYHHANWRELQNYSHVDEHIKVLAQLLNIADRADIFLNEMKGSWDGFRRELEKHRNEQFSVQAIELIMGLESYDLSGDRIETDAEFERAMCSVCYTQEEVNAYLIMLVYMIDFRSRHTVTHTMATASISSELTRLLGLDDQVRDLVVSGAILHDLGKIGIPVEILENPGKLNAQEMEVMKTHVTITGIIMGEYIAPEVRRIALRHHEKLDGSGYPEGLKAADLTLPERIVAVSDIVSALSGKRSYKEAFSKEKTLQVIQSMTEQGLLDEHVSNCLCENYDDIMKETKRRCDPVREIYEHIYTEFYQIEQTHCVSEP